MCEECVPKCPVDRNSRWDGQREHIQCCKQKDILELGWFVHSVHNLSAPHQFYQQLVQHIPLFPNLT